MPFTLIAWAEQAVNAALLDLVLYFYLLRTLGSLGATAQAYLRVPIGVGIGVVFLGERLQPAAWIGVALVVAMALPRRQQRSMAGSEMHNAGRRR